ncbi:hypothetical protein R1sor_019397 [Riccia sorocarpa]|uniref:RING-type domain-containing protein n=1 Tax=Riccia sorocarpa TaxID=122646 RepID=A0ABD3IG73_9MARC
MLRITDFELPRYRKVEFPEWYFIHYQPKSDDEDWDPYRRENSVNFYLCRKENCQFQARAKSYLTTHVLEYHGEELPNRGKVKRYGPQPLSKFISRDESRLASLTRTKLLSWPNTQDTEDPSWRRNTDTIKNTAVQGEPIELLSSEGRQEDLNSCGKTNFETTSKPDPIGQSKDADKGESGLANTPKILEPSVQRKQLKPPGESKLQSKFTETKSTEQKLEAEVKRLTENLMSEKAKRLKLKTGLKHSKWTLKAERKRLVGDMNLLELKLESAEAKLLCSICMEGVRDTLILPCSHFQYCSGCLLRHKRRSNTCPTCRGVISALLHCQFSES